MPRIFDNIDEALLDALLILTTFPLVDDNVKSAALQAYGDLRKELIK
jgi:hypothetical protein